MGSNLPEPPGLMGMSTLQTVQSGSRYTWYVASVAKYHHSCDPTALQTAELFKARFCMAEQNRCQELTPDATFWLELGIHHLDPQETLIH
jgi:hypothetical protein